MVILIKVKKQMVVNDGTIKIEGLFHLFKNERKPSAKTSKRMSY